ncbi:MAG: aminotransferase class V-fold PLP-dependent enzyme [Candidatus Thorarchaeota archaeon]
MDIRSDFSILEKNPTLAYFDSASTTLMPKVVPAAISDFLNNVAVSTRRGAHSLATKGSVAVENTRNSIAEFLKTDSSQISFQNSIPTAIASFAFGYFKQNPEKKSIVVAENEEHSVLVTLQRVSQILNLELRTIPINETGLIDIQILDDLVDERTGITAVSTVTVGWGVSNPIQQVSTIAHEKESVHICDASRSIAFEEKMPMEFGVDFLVFSGNIGMMGPPGLTIQWLNKALSVNHIPGILGGNSVSNVTASSFELALPPDKFESGTINVPGIIGFHSALRYITNLRKSGMIPYVKELSKYLQKRFGEMESITVYGIPNDSTTIFGFNLGSDDGISCHDIALFLDESNIAVRSGLLCAHPLVKQVSPDGILQVSLHAYNSIDDINRLVENLQKIASDLI